MGVRMDWHWHSDVERAARGEPSILAVVETLLATCASLIISVWYFDTYIHIFISVCIGPFLLLRTELSTVRGFRWHRITCGYVLAPLFWLGAILGRNKILEKILFIPFWGLLFFTISITLPLEIIIVKIVATCISALQHPIEAIQAIPKNWRRYILVIDSFHPPETLPNLESSILFKNNNLMIFSELKKKIYTDFISPHSWPDRCVGVPLFSLLALLLFVPALFYRWSLKSTSVVYLPLLWVGAENRKPQETAYKFILRIGKGWFERFLRMWAIFILVALILLPFMLWIGIINLLPEWKSLQIWLSQFLAVNPFLQEYFIPTEHTLNSWHIARFVSAVITLWILHKSQDYILDIEAKQLEHNNLESQANYLSHLITIRKIFGLWTIACGLYLLYSHLSMTVDELLAAIWGFFEDIKVKLVPW